MLLVPLPQIRIARSFTFGLTAAVIALATVCSAQNGVSAKSLPSKADRDSFFQSAFTIVTSVELFPANVKQSFATVTKEPSFALANPGQEYQATDVVNPKKRRLPWRRLIFAGRSGDKWFIHYERGGIGHYYAVVLLKADGGNTPQFLGGRDRV